MATTADERLLGWSSDTGGNPLSESTLAEPMELHRRALERAAIARWFSDARAESDDRLPAGVGSDPRGFWGDYYSGRPAGSRLWLLRRAKRDANTAARVAEYLEEALQPLIEDGLISRVEADIEVDDMGRISGGASIYREPGDERLDFRFDYLWEELFPV